ncbi:cation/calcium exchanger 5 isoform X2 [Syzygium oleosum]|uniref:cation/calcium exchanger 5 isoform X2 n=1 Tax=Syzygium oleosum TaxID=219896 RepID=UPI0024B95955|nr:cation/calcium exchanger 5 isoform X2 [Syzygium oleosum]
MLEQANKGNKLGFTLNDEAWRDRVYPFNKVFRLYSMKDFVNGRCDCLKRKYEYIRNVLGRRGFPWEGLKKLVPADYDAYNLNSHRTESDPNHCVLSLIRGNSPSVIQRHHHISYYDGTKRSYYNYWRSNWMSPTSLFVEVDNHGQGGIGLCLSFSPIKKCTIFLVILSTLAFFLLIVPPPSSSYIPLLPTVPRRSLSSNVKSITAKPCSLLAEHSGIVDYSALHSCLFDQNPYLSIPFLSLFLLIHFYILIKTAQDHFSIVTTKLSSHLNLTPSMGAVTLLALGNGSPDVFSSVAAVRSGQYRTGFGAILSAGTFVSAFVVGFVAIYAAPFPLNPTQFVRDVLFYMIATLFLFWVYLSGEIFIWQAFGFVGFYVFFVVFVFWMDLGSEREKGRAEVGLVGHSELSNELAASDCERGSIDGSKRRVKVTSGLHRPLNKISKAWKVPVSFLLKLTIPQTSPSEWNRLYISLNIIFCPLALLYACNSFMPTDHPIVFLVPNAHFPLWLIVLFTSSSLAILHFIMEKEPPKTEQLFVILVAFVMSVFWISTIAGELLNCLAALGTLLDLPPSLLGLTVLAWGNSVGDLVADVAIAKAGQPAMAMAGCFAGPMFNMLVGLGTALVMQTANVYPEAYVLHFHVGIVIAFVFLLLSLMGSLLVITWCRFRVHRFWGLSLVGIYVLFMIVSVAIAKFST